MSSRMAPTVAVLIIQIVTILLATHSGAKLTPNTTTDIIGFSLPLFREDIPRGETVVSAMMTNGTTAPEIFRPRLTRSWYESSLHVSVAIGNNKQPFSLILDTASDLTWVHCEPCNTLGRHLRAVFYRSASSTYRVMSSDDPLCREFNHNVDTCTFSGTYRSHNARPPGTIQGSMSRDFFSFGGETIRNVGFGCAHRSIFKTIQDYPEGVLGMSPSPASFIQQVKDITGGRFSYCHSRSPAARYGYLNFGSDIPTLRGGIQTIPFSVDNGQQEGHYFYSFTLKRIRIMGKGFGVALFDSTKSASPLEKKFNLRLSIVSSVEFSALSSPIYKKLVDVLASYFDHLKLRRMDIEVGGRHFQLCYQLPEKFDDSLLPTVHFDFSNGGSFMIDSGDVFQDMITTHGGEGSSSGGEYRRTLCLAMVEDKDNLNVLGAYQQNNRRFVFDVVNNYVRFAHEDCSQDCRHDPLD